MNLMGFRIKMRRVFISLLQQDGKKMSEIKIDRVGGGIWGYNLMIKFGYLLIVDDKEVEDFVQIFEFNN